MLTLLLDPPLTPEQNHRFYLEVTKLFLTTTFSSSFVTLFNTFTGHANLKRTQWRETQPDNAKLNRYLTVSCEPSSLVVKGLVILG
jgi:hypothetical protein